MKGLFRPPCSVCGAACATIEIVAPHELPLEWAQRSPEHQKLFRDYRNSDEYYLLYSGPGGGNGCVGDKIDYEKAARIVDAFSGPASKEAICAAGFFDNAGFCLSCSLFYCYKHWSVSKTGYGSCPNKHGQSLDPHWSPDD
jgi:hypothetical protein